MIKIVYAGTPEFAVAPLKKLYENGCNIVAVITQEDKPQGRKMTLTPPPVKVFAEQNNIPVYQFAKIRDNIEILKSLNADYMITCAYGQILTQEVIDCFKGIFNIHASLLPKYRGASPVQSAVLNGEKTTGVTIMKTDIGLDTGDILLQKSVDILNGETYGELLTRLSIVGADAILEAVKLIESGNFALTKQDNSKATVVRKINKMMAQINFADTTFNVLNLIWGMNPSPIAYCYLNGVALNVYNAEKTEFLPEYQGKIFGEALEVSAKKGIIVKTLDGAVKLSEVQLAGGKKMKATDFANGKKIEKGYIFRLLR